MARALSTSDASRNAPAGHLSRDLPVRQDGVPVLQVRDLDVRFPSENGSVHAVRGVDLTVHAGEIVCVVGESGSGKSVTSTSVMGLLPDQAKVSGSVKLHGTELLGRDDAWMSKVRGKQMGMVFQDPLSALTPVYTVGDQIVEALTVHGGTSEADARTRAVELLELVGIPNPKVRVKAFPHEFSGGMRQRAMIAIAIANNPDLIIADEPTTALDVTIQAQILDVLRTAQQETGAGVVFITHDLGVVASMADRVAVMYAGRIVERGEVHEIFERARMPYTIGLLGSLPRLDDVERKALAPVEGNPPSLLNLPPGCPFAPRCPMAVDECRTVEPALEPIDDAHAAAEAVAVPAAGDLASAVDLRHDAACHRKGDVAAGNLTYREIYPVPQVAPPPFSGVPRTERDEVLAVEGLVKEFPLMKGAVFKRRVGTVHAVAGIDFDIRQGETLGLVGESGCGKTTTLLEILDLVKPQDGRIVVLGQDTAQMRAAQRKAVRRDLQVVFQDPMASLDPRMPVFDLIAEPLASYAIKGKEAEKRVEELMSLVGLEASHANRYPQHFSGGQRQRIGIARALALEPKVLVLDEPVSALDVSIRAGVINLLDDLRSRLGLSYLFVAHDLSVVRHISDRVAVMYLGRIAEIGDVDTVFDHPVHPYTQALLSAIPIPDPEVERSRERILLTGDLPSPADPPSGCRFRTRCPLFQTLSDPERQKCIDIEPEVTRSGIGMDHGAACHYQREVAVL